MYIPYSERECVDFASLVGSTLIKVETSEDDVIHFETSHGDKYVMYHEQDCCEGVEIEDINGDLSDLIGHPILMAEEVISHDEEKDEDKIYDASNTWTFYKIATIKGTVTIRWHGSSNGYYSESVDFVKLPKEEDE